MEVAKHRVSGDDGDVRVLITGVGNAFTSRHFGSSALIEAPEGHVMIDCPDLVHRAIRAAAEVAGWTVGPLPVCDVILTHLHGDPCNGLESLGFLARRRRAENPTFPRPRLYVTAPVAARLWERLAPAMDAPFDGAASSTIDDFFDVRIMTPEQGDGDAPAAARVAGLSVRCRFTGHPVPTIGLLIDDGTATLGWAGDTPFEHAHIDWLSRADLVVHEANGGRAHTDIEDLNTLPDTLRRKMRLIHLEDDFDPSRSDIVQLHEGEVLEL